MRRTLLTLGICLCTLLWVNSADAQRGGRGGRGGGWGGGGSGFSLGGVDSRGFYGPGFYNNNYGWGGYGRGYYGQGYGYGPGWYGGSNWYGGGPYYGQSYYSDPGYYSSGYYDGGYVDDGSYATSTQGNFSQGNQGTMQNRAHFMVMAPPNAQVWFDNKRVEANGPMHEFMTPPLEPGYQYKFHVKAQWQENGQTVTRTKDISFQPGQRMRVDFRQGQDQGQPTGTETFDGRSDDQFQGTQIQGQKRIQTNTPPPLPDQQNRNPQLDNPPTPNTNTPNTNTPNTNTPNTNTPNNPPRQVPNNPDD